MSAERYLRSVVASWSARTGRRSDGARAAGKLAPYIEDWAETFFVKLFAAGSYAKNTAIRGGSDIDLFLSLSSNLGVRHKDIFGDFGRFLRGLRIDGNKLTVRTQNVSYRVILNGMAIDIVPGRRKNSAGNQHHIYVRKQQSYTLTDVRKQVAYAKRAGREREIKAIKIWCLLNQLDFPSFVLELAVIDALYGRRRDCLEANLGVVFEYLVGPFARRALRDPGNLNNVVSHKMSKQAKRGVVAAAKRALAADDWEQVLFYDEELVEILEEEAVGL